MASVVAGHPTANLMRKNQARSKWKGNINANG
jgi:hypothetical protein